MSRKIVCAKIYLKAYKAYGILNIAIQAYFLFAAGGVKSLPYIELSGRRDRIVALNIEYKSKKNKYLYK
ncbi:hypothetical protein LQZ18_12035 [Lachnospiraceae bacterium ZAX-1]